MNQPSKCRWFQIGLGDLIALTSLLGVAWGELAARPTLSHAVKNSTTQHWYGTATTTGGVFEWRRPSASQVACRGAIVSGVVIAAWWIGRRLLRARLWVVMAWCIPYVVLIGFVISSYYGTQLAKRPSIFGQFIEAFSLAVDFAYGVMLTGAWIALIVVALVARWVWLRAARVLRAPIKDAQATACRSTFETKE